MIFVGKRNRIKCRLTVLIECYILIEKLVGESGKPATVRVETVRPGLRSVEDARCDAMRCDAIMPWTQSDAQGPVGWITPDPPPLPCPTLLLLS